MEQTEIFKTFMQEKFMAFKREMGVLATVTQFAKELSLKAESGEVVYTINQGDLSHWLRGNRVPGVKTVRVLAKSKWIGPAIWKAAGFDFEPAEELDPLELQVIEAMRRLPRPMQVEFAKEAERRAAEARARKTPTGAPVYQQVQA